MTSKHSYAHTRILSFSFTGTSSGESSRISLYLSANKPRVPKWCILIRSLPFIPANACTLSHECDRWGNLHFTPINGFKMLSCDENNAKLIIQIIVARKVLFVLISASGFRSCNMSENVRISCEVHYETLFLIRDCVKRQRPFF